MATILRYRKKQKSFLSFLWVLKLSVGLNIILLGVILCSGIGGNLREKTLVWHGGHPKEAKAGSCFCNAEKFCMCTPGIAIDLVLVSHNLENVWLVERSDTGQLATIGGFVEVGETVEEAVIRELKEELSVSVSKKDLKLMGVYSDPRRDNRRHTVSVVFAIQLPSDNIHPRAGDDAKNVLNIPLTDIEKHSYFADHKTILMDYKRSVDSSSNKLSKQQDGDFANNIERSICEA